jgi:phosphoesterase RecJ-like protein
MKNFDVKPLQAAINSANNICITSHFNPDGDAVGSSLGFYWFLKGLGKNVHIILPNSIPDFLLDLPGVNEIIIFSEQKDHAAQILKQTDLLFSLDYNTLSRVGADMQAALEACVCPKILIDHHLEPSPDFYQYFSDTEVCSTSEIVFYLIEQMNGLVLMGKEGGSGIYTGIMTDSGSFRFATVSSMTHRTVATLIDMGVKHHKLHEKVYDSASLVRYKLMGRMLDRIEILDQKACVLYLTKEDFWEIGGEKGDTEGFVNMGLSIKGIEICGFFSEEKEKVKISFRSKGDIDVNTFARQYFEGGGHKNAAGGSSKENLNTTLQKFRNLVLEYLKP